MNDERVNINSTTNSGITPLHLAAAYTTMEIVSLFVKNPKCNKFCKTIQDKTPYDFAIQNNTDDIALLLKPNTDNSDAPVSPRSPKSPR